LPSPGSHSPEWPALSVLDIIVALLALPALLASGYLLLLTVCSARGLPPSSPGRALRFAVVVPAHDEEAGIGRTVESLLALEWPRDRVRVVVVADNCSDGTAAAAARAGATVLVRQDLARRGKGYALEFAFERILAGDEADAVVVIDADTTASPDLLRAMAARIEAGAHALQARYGVLNPDASWRTRLMTIAFAAVNDLRPLGRERLGLSCGLKGNGMCFTAEALRRVPHRAFSIVEDLEYGIQLAEAGMRVHYVWESGVRGEMVAGGAASRSQRQRWEGGRRDMAQARALPLLGLALRRRDPVLLDLALDLWLPPLARVAGYTAIGFLGAAQLWRWGWIDAGPVAAWLAGIAFLALYVARGVQLSGLGLRGVWALAAAPAYVLWKAIGLRSAPPPGEWVRTAREGGPSRTPEQS